jgi:hypothetical protein
MESCLKEFALRRRIFECRVAVVGEQKGPLRLWPAVGEGRRMVPRMRVRDASAGFVAGTRTVINLFAFPKGRIGKDRFACAGGTAGGSAVYQGSGCVNQALVSFVAALLTRTLHSLALVQRRTARR